MSIISSKGVEFSDAPLEEDLDLDLVPFNDLSIVAGWENARRIKFIQEIVVYYEENVVVGIELVYMLDHDQTSPRIVHGKKTQLHKKICITEQKRVIAAFVGIHEQKIMALRFTKTDLTQGTVSTEGYITEVEPESLEWHVAFGEISAFRGTKIRGDDGRLVTLGIQTRYLGPKDMPKF